MKQGQRFEATHAPDTGYGIGITRSCVARSYSWRTEPTCTSTSPSAKGSAASAFEAPIGAPRASREATLTKD